MNEQAPAGWHPQGEGTERYWDGDAWTDQTRPLGGTNAPKKAGAFSKIGDALRNSAAEKNEAKLALIRQRAKDAQVAGSLVTSGVFGTSTIEIYENGYVRVATWGESHTGTDPRSIYEDTPFEKLRSIKFAQGKDQPSDATSALEKTVGPAVSALMKGGKGLMKATAPGMAIAGIAHLSSNAARKTFLTIATDKHIHTMSNQSNRGVGIKISHRGHDDVGRALEIAGNAVLGVAESSPPAASVPAIATSPSPLPPPSQSTATPTLTDRLREMAALHKDGIISDEEFTNAKAKLLGGL